ncbi:LysR family transcriptional regulator, glycine cleavage system transcriptional activator [Variovorax sp. HW608]|uniref:LysR substrate-binding domain-containing protein n=1 Tax=Variovorax sp. HW608 TaxID=1034889 RepID=UPI00081FF4B0|nr:LysR substrate-binding domain-containing protein [Variovorax sp. HW608]SCK42936.1 LysR family transcriptional regulator, glycine cleavage system transcriptional activator [Variovorax sp. HW608]
MIRKLPSLNAVRAFEAAARHVSFTEAAEELCVTHGAISREVALLEEWFGRPLFRRSSWQLTLTDAGRRYLPEVTAALDRLALASMYVLGQRSSTSLRVSAPPAFTMRWLIPRMSGFQRRRRDVEIRLMTSLERPNLQADLYDVAIRGAHEAMAADCGAARFMSEHILPVCHVDLLKGGALLEPKDIARHTIINYATESYPWHEWLQSAGVCEVRPANSLKFEQMYFALQAACEGLGIVLVPLFLVLDDIISGKLCAPFGPLGIKRRDYYASFATESDAYPLIATFCGWLEQEGCDTERSIEEWARSRGWNL